MACLEDAPAFQPSGGRTPSLRHRALPGTDVQVLQTLFDSLVVLPAPTQPAVGAAPSVRSGPSAPQPCSRAPLEARSPFGSAGSTS